MGLEDKTTPAAWGGKAGGSSPDIQSTLFKQYAEAYGGKSLSAFSFAQELPSHHNSLFSGLAIGASRRRRFARQNIFFVCSLVSFHLCTSLKSQHPHMNRHSIWGNGPVACVLVDMEGKYSSSRQDRN
jgi:hypothetical protein